MRPESPAGNRPPSVLALTNMYPTTARPALGTFVQDRVEALRALGIAVNVMHIDRDQGGRAVYRRLRTDLALAPIEGEFDLVHVMYGGVMADVATRSLELPAVVTFCGTDLNGMPLGGLTDRVSAAYGVWASRRAARRAAAVIVMTDTMAERLPRTVPRDRIFVIPDGVDLSRFRPLDRDDCRRRLGWPSDRRYVLGYGRDEGKRISLAAEAVRAAWSRSGKPVELKILSGVPHDQVPIWINACNVALLTSVAEGSPNILKEALASDTPVISTDVGDARERLRDIEGCEIVD